jgi:hypothetical protein
MAYLRGQVVSGSSFYTGSQTISGSLVVEADPAVSDFFIIKSGSAELLKANDDGVIQFHVFEDSYTPPVSLGAIYFHSSSAYVGLEE